MIYVNLIHRFLNICKPGRSLATKTPTFDDLLPVDDKLWDDGVGSPSFPFSLDI
jgi:hypothetical protein